MSSPTDMNDEQTRRLHRIVESGSLRELKLALEGGAPINNPGHIGRTSLMVAANAKDLEKMRLLVDHGADPELADDFNSTALRHAVEVDFVAGVEFLLSLGVDRGYRPKYPLKRVVFDEHLMNIELPEDCGDLISDQEWAATQSETLDWLTDPDQDPSVTPVISEVQSAAVLSLFLQAGDELSLASTESKRELLGLIRDVEFKSSATDYRRYRSPHFGARNPDRMENAFWCDMIRTGVNAYAAREQFGDQDAHGPVWCYDRFGSSLTALPDGRFVQIGGEHEDFYDPDFYIYNDVVIHDGQGEFQILGYPEDVFPPTDFHSATLVGESIYIIGCLGYQEQRRAGFTPVYRLELDGWRIVPVVTNGEMPGWIHGHLVRFDPQAGRIRVTGGEVHGLDEEGQLTLRPNPATFELDLNSSTWHQIGDAAD